MANDGIIRDEDDLALLDESGEEIQDESFVDGGGDTAFPPPSTTPASYHGYRGDGVLTTSNVITDSAAGGGNSKAGYAGHANAADYGNWLAQLDFYIEQKLSRVSGSAMVEIVAVHPDVSGAVGFVDIKPMAHQINGDGKTTPHETIYHVPYSRSQGGRNAVIMDPVVGDRGIAVFSDRDISSVKDTRQPGPPGSRRMNSMADAMYVGGMRNGPSVNYIDLTGEQIKIVTQIDVTIQAAGHVIVQAPHVQVTSDDVAITGTSLTHNSKNVGSTHTHPDAQGGTTGSPT